MGLKKVSLSEAVNFPMGFEVTEELLDKSLPSLDAILRKNGLLGSDSKEGVVSSKQTENAKLK